MKNKYIIIYGTIVLLLSLHTHAQNSLKGMITDARDNKGLEGVSIYVPDLRIGSVSNKEGVFYITHIPTGRYLIEVSCIGYASRTQKVDIMGETTLNYSLSASGTELKEAVVTNVSSATERQKNPVPVNIVTKKELLQKSYTNIIDAISGVPGISQITDGPAISKPVIRGLGYNRVVVINDGIRQEGQQWGDEFGIEVDANTVGRVEILKGPASLSYGSDAMAGVINFLPPPTLTDGQIKGSILANYQTNNGLYGGYANLAGNQRGYVWDFGYSFSQAHDYKNKYDGYIWNSAFGENHFKAMVGINRKWGYSHLTVSAFDLKLGIIEGLRDSISGNFLTHYLTADHTEDSLAIAPHSGYKMYNNYPIIHQHVRHYKVNFDNVFVSGRSTLGVRLGYQENYRQEANDITKGNIYNNYFFLRTFNYNLQYALPETRNFDLVFGLNGMAQSSEDRGLVYLVPEYNSFDLGFFSIAKKTYKKFTISGGLRYDSRVLHGKDLYVDSTGARVNLATAADIPIHRFQAYNSNFAGLSGSFGVAYDFTQNLYGKFNVARGFRAPNIAESGSDGLHDGTPFYEIGDPALKPENSLQVDGTLGINSELLTFEFNAFSNKINNYIFPVKLGSVYGGDSLRNDPTVDPDEHPTFKYISGDALLSGGEVMLDIHPLKSNWFHFENSISFLRAIQLNADDSTKYLPYMPPTKFQSKLRFTYRKINTTFQNAYFNIGIEAYAEQNKIYYKFGNETTTPGYTLLNAGIGTDICSSNRTICSIHLIGTNLSDIAYQSNMSRLKYSDTNNTTGRIGVFNMGRNFTIKVIVPFNFTNK